MAVIVTDAGFRTAEPETFLDAAALKDEGRDLFVDLPNDADPGSLQDHLARIALIRIPFPSFADGRAFSVAKRLRLMGFRGRLRAVGHVLADQYPLARRSGFDEVEIDDALATRQPEAQWRRFSDWQSDTYQTRVRRHALTGA